MAYKRILSTASGELRNNTQLAIRFLVEQLGALHRKHPVHDNIVVLNGKSWWVIPAISNQGVDLCNGRNENPIALIDKIKNLHANILIVRQMADHRLCIYQITELDNLSQRLETYLIPLWDTIEIVKTSSDIGIMVGNELIGFRKLRNKQPEPI